MLTGDAEKRWMSLFRQRDPVYRQVANLVVPTRGMTPKAAAKRMIEMVAEHTVHVDGRESNPTMCALGKER